MKYLVLHCAALTALLSSAPATAQAGSAAIGHYVQCFLVSNLLAQNKDPKAKLVGNMASNFFAGQIFGANPNIDVAAAFRREAVLLRKQPDGKALLARCLGEMKARSGQVTAAGKALAADTAKMRAKP